jgi:hypothetical protein
LTYHHFDPPWRVEHHHDPARMIALCWHHHQVAEDEAFTVDQLRQMKRAPFLNAGRVGARFDGWNQRRLALFAGGNWFVGPPFVLAVRNQVVIGLTPPIGDTPGGLNLDIRNPAGRPVLAMTANDWDLDVVPDDLICRPRGSTLYVRHLASEISLDIKFHSLTPAKLDQFLKRRCPMVQREDLRQSLSGATWPIAVATLSGFIPWPARVVLDFHRTVDVGRRSLYEGSVFQGDGIRL